jgi:hypothetical protein
MKHPDLKELLNDESFIRWLNDKAAFEEQQTWDRWLGDDPRRQLIVHKAEKIMTMPFVEELPPDVENELCTFQEKMAALRKN